MLYSGLLQVESGAFLGKEVLLPQGFHRPLDTGYIFFSAESLTGQGTRDPVPSSSRIVERVGLELSSKPAPTSKRRTFPEPLLQ